MVEQLDVGGSLSSESTTSHVQLAKPDGEVSTIQNLILTESNPGHDTKM